MPTWDTPPRVLKNTRSPSFNSVAEIIRDTLYWSLAVRGKVIPKAERYTACTKAEQSTPLLVVPPIRYLVPYHSSTYSSNCISASCSTSVFNRTAYLIWIAEAFSTEEERLI